MNWGNNKIELRPFSVLASDFPTDFAYFVDVHGPTDRSPSIDQNNNNKIVRSKISRSNSNDGAHVETDKENPIRNMKKENFKRYHPYKVENRFEEFEHKSSPRNHFEKDRRSARRILEEKLGAPLLGKFENVFRQYIVSVKVDGRRYFGTGRSFNEARNDAAENALKSIQRR